MEAFQRVLHDVGISLSEETYWTRYLGIPDRGIARDVLRGREGAGSLDDAVDHVLARKALAYRDLVRHDLPEVPGASSFIHKAAERWPIAVASGAIRVEVEDGLYRLGVRDAVTAIVSIEDVVRGKPDPEVFLTARARLTTIPFAGSRAPRTAASMPEARHRLSMDEPSSSFLVIEDSPAGLAAARAAWMPAVGVATSRPRSDLVPADLVVDDLASLDLDAIETIGAGA